MSNFRSIDRQTGFLLPPSVDEWLPEKHLARFIVEVIDGLDLRAMSGSYRGSGSASYHPRMLLGILVYGYATGGEAETLLADTGYFSTANVEACEQAGIEPLIAMGRQPHHPPLQGVWPEGNV